MSRGGYSGFFRAAVLFAMLFMIFGCGKDKGKAEKTAEAVKTKGVKTVEADQQQLKINSALGEILKGKRKWDVVMMQWVGTDMPEWTFTDIHGRKHSLADYHGKNIMMVFWATWCPPCNVEIPHLKELREKISENDLAIIAISNEDPRTVKSFARQKLLNYTTVSYQPKVPRPFSQVRSIPTAFYIDRQGKIRLITAGVVPSEDMKRILRAIETK